MSRVRNVVERAVRQAWFGGFPWTLIFAPLLPITWLYVVMKRYRRSPHVARELGVPVIVIGGITAGGTGKTPTLIALTLWLSAKGLRVGIVSRGYGRIDAKKEVLVDREDTAHIAGDEPLLIKRAVPDAQVLVAADRRSGAVRLISDCDVEVIIADDGLQHYTLPRDFEVVVLDDKLGVGNGMLLPVGPLRELKSRLKTVDFVLKRNGALATTSLTYSINCVRHYASGNRMSIDEFVAARTDRQVVAATGLGQPEQFFRMLSQAGLSLQTVTVADHAQLSLHRIERKYSPDTILITEKDAVKLDSASCDNVWVVEISAHIPEPLKHKIADLLGLAADT